MIISDIAKVMALNKNILCQLVESMSDAEINNRTGSCWTISEQLEHLVVCQDVLLRRMKQFIAESKPVIEPYSPDNKKNANGKCAVEKLLQKYCELRNEQISLVSSAGKDVWQKEGAHEEYKKYTFEIFGKARSAARFVSHVPDGRIMDRKRKVHKTS